MENHTECHIFGAKISMNKAKEVRNLLGLTQEDFARLLGVSAPAVQRWEYGTSNPKYLQADIINKLYDKREKLCKMQNSIKENILGNGISESLYKLLKFIFEEL